MEIVCVHISINHQSLIRQYMSLEECVQLEKSTETLLVPFDPLLSSNLLPSATIAVERILTTPEMLLTSPDPPSQLLSTSSVSKLTFVRNWCVIIMKYLTIQEPGRPIFILEIVQPHILTTHIGHVYKLGHTGAEVTASWS